MAPLINLRQVTVRREQTVILNHVSTKIERGQHTAILGPNGSGKSSLLKLLTRDFYPSIDDQGFQGDVEILGQRSWQVHELRRSMGIVSPMLDSEFSHGRTGRMTVTEAVISGFTATRLKEFGPEVTDEIREAAKSAIESVGMTGFKDKPVERLSTGERRRTMIARAIVHRPPIFVLDEPTGGLDMTAKATFLDVIETLSGQQEITLVLVTHHLDEIPPKMDHVVLLDQGTITYDGAKQSALTSQRISSLFKLPVQITQNHQGWYDARKSDRD
ncbi:ATP-binding cassette domain-containing protein [Stieleria sp. JC731]|uniref:ABC transporter ATP-binding protein n=1 Tax=Pirellulaceae TaxID=2691357 RepID=UPI001E5087C1|nr:ATP-binding cassette domain-containing protein [Stieleria sp. JC731]MCC9602465.1 ATP-binding cassette domain-containing protein [Stieleria sp. JC731]